MRDFNQAVTALRRLIDARKVLEDRKPNEQSNDKCDDTESVEDEIFRVLEEIEAEEQNLRDQGPLPD